MKKRLVKIIILTLILLVVVYFALVFIFTYRPTYPSVTSYEGLGPEMTAQECWDRDGKVISISNEGSGCLTKKDFLGVVTGALCRCVCCRDRFWNF